MLSRRRLSLLAGMGAASVLARPAFAQTAPVESTWARIRRTRKLRVGAVANGTPYYLKDPISGQWRGFYYEASKKLAEDLEAELEIYETVWGNGVLDIQSKKVDIFFGIAPNPKRALAVDFTDAIFTSISNVIVKDGHSVTQWQEINNPDMRIAVDAGSNHDQVISLVCPKANILRFKSVEDASTAMMAGRAEVQACSMMLSLAILKKNPRLGKLFIPTPRFSAESAGAFFREDDRVFKDYMSYWVRYYRGIGFFREAILRNLELLGLTEKDWPADVPL
jgi:polar amino acid transport system substrate-binding protein